MNLSDVVVVGSNLAMVRSSQILYLPFVTSKLQAFVILDEAQNATVAQMKMFLTRMGEGSKIVVSGDITQVDLPSGVSSGLRDAVQRLQGIEGISFVRLNEGDIVRHPLVRKIVAAYDGPSHGPGPNRSIGGNSASGRAFPAGDR